MKFYEVKCIEIVERTETYKVETEDELRQILSCPCRLQYSALFLTDEKIIETKADEIRELTTGKSWFTVCGHNTGEGGLLHELLDKDYHPIEQWTGIQDKNGVMLFENDIVVSDDNGEYS